jgi:hypothetical protein
MTRSIPPKGGGKERMSRKLPRGAKPGRRPEDPKEAYTQAQLAEVGAIALIWNQIDNFLNWLIYIALKPPNLIIWEVGRRLRGTHAKIELLRIAAERAELLNGEARASIKYTLDGIIDCNRYRDNIIHSFPFDADKDIASAFKHHTDVVQMLMSNDALSGLYQRMKLILDEMRQIDLLYRLADEAGARAVYRHEGFDPLERRRTRDVPMQTAQAVAHQNKRKALPPLPEFPGEDEAPPGTEEIKPPPRSEGTD